MAKKSEANKVPQAISEIRIGSKPTGRYVQALKITLDQLQTQGNGKVPVVISAWGKAAEKARIAVEIVKQKFYPTLHYVETKKELLEQEGKDGKYFVTASTDTVST